MDGKTKASSGPKDTLSVPSTFRLPFHSNSDGTIRNSPDSLLSQQDDDIPLSQSLARATLESSMLTIPDSQEEVFDRALLAVTAWPSPTGLDPTELDLPSPSPMSICSLSPQVLLPPSSPMSICSPTQSFQYSSQMSICSPTQSFQYPSQMSLCASPEGDARTLNAGLQSGFEMQSGYSSFRQKVQSRKASRVVSSGGRSSDSSKTTIRPENVDNPQKSHKADKTDDTTADSQDLSTPLASDSCSSTEEDVAEDEKYDSDIFIGRIEELKATLKSSSLGIANSSSTRDLLRQTISRFPQPPSHASNLSVAPPKPISNARSKVQNIKEQFALYIAGRDSPTPMRDGASSIPADNEGKVKSKLSAPYQGRIPKAARASFVARSNAHAAKSAPTTHKRTVLVEIPDSQGETDDEIKEEDEDGDVDDTDTDETVKNVHAQKKPLSAQTHKNNTGENGAFNKTGHCGGNNECQFTYSSNSNILSNSNALSGLQPSGGLVGSVQYTYPMHRMPFENTVPPAGYDRNFNNSTFSRKIPVQHRVGQLRENNENMLHILSRHCGSKLNLFSTELQHIMNGALPNNRRSGLDFVTEMRVAVENVRMLCAAQMEVLRRMETSYLIENDTYGTWVPQDVNTNAHGKSTRQKRNASCQSQASGNRFASSSDGSSTSQQDSVCTNDGSSIHGRRTRLKTGGANRNQNVRSAPGVITRPSERNVTGARRQEPSGSFMDVDEDTSQENPRST